MKARLLQKELNTERTVHLSDNKVCVASAYVHDLIHIKLDDMTVHYVFGEDNPWKQDDEVKLLLVKLRELVANGEINKFLEGDDVIENPLPVFTVINNKLVSTFTDKYGWPNITIDGMMMYENTFFKTKKDALKYAIEEKESSIKYYKETAIPEAKEKVRELESRLWQNQNELVMLGQQLFRVNE